MYKVHTDKQLKPSVLVVAFTVSNEFIKGLIYD